MAWHCGMAWHGLAWLGMAWHGMRGARQGLAWRGVAWHGISSSSQKTTPVCLLLITTAHQPAWPSAAEQRPGGAPLEHTEQRTGQAAA